ncbi:helix-turn-helix domain-containing protein [Quatrionicoccus australiensis]|uniref:helix-turn-helix domain-containing protein n=1 Tax=Quatrionicoccus australiensis TaxID=138118 RepID=UPI001CF83048|nr:helix-turn-helix domain-containing protein [Quatrionicoccus australiensis]UCV16648.1 helix-turn-helix domain-containing protein [Quatrionicoccus australiensis]
MDAIEISYRLRRLGKTQAQIARDVGVSGGVVSNVIYGRISAYAVAQHIAGLLGLSIEELWPERYVFKPRHAVSKRLPHEDGATDGEVKP